MIIGRTALKVAGMVLAGAVGFILMWSAWHLYTDHQTLHVLITIEQQRQLQRPPALPTGGS
jgi:hypothetical protein